MTGDRRGRDGESRPEGPSAAESAALDELRVLSGDPTAAEAAAAVAVVRAALEQGLREHERLRLNATDDWNLSQRSIRAAGPFGGEHRRKLR